MPRATGRPVAARGEVRRAPAAGRFRNVDQGIKGRDPGPGAVGDVKRRQVGLAEFDRRGEPSRLFDHHRRQVDAAHLDALFVQVTGDVSRPATQVAGRPDVPHGGGEAVEKLPVERLVFQLIENPPHVLVGDGVVAGPAVPACFVVHRLVLEPILRVALPVGGAVARQCASQGGIVVPLGERRRVMRSAEIGILAVCVTQWQAGMLAPRLRFPPSRESAQRALWRLTVADLRRSLHAVRRTDSIWHARPPIRLGVPGRSSCLGRRRSRGQGDSAPANSPGTRCFATRPPSVQAARGYAATVGFRRTN